MMADGKTQIGAALAIAAAALVLSGCGGGGNRSTDATTTAPAAGSPVAPTATSSVGRCPADSDVCDFAREIAGLIAAGRYDAIADRTHLYDFTCPGGTPSGAGGPFPLCSGAASGERRTGYSVGALQSEGAVESRDGLIDLLHRWANVEAPATVIAEPVPVLATVGCPLVDGAPACDDRFAVVFTRGDDLSLLRFGVQRDGAGGVPLIAQTITGIIRLNQAMVSGGDDSLPVVFGIDEDVGARYFVID